MERRRTAGRGVHQVAVCGVMTAVLCVLGPLSLPVGPVPISLGTLGLYLAGLLLGWRRGVGCCVAYLLLGAAGLPVFAGYAGGVGCILGPTGGYLAGYVPLVLLTGWAAQRTGRRSVRLVGMAAGTAACYALGTLWYARTTHTPLGAALAVCVLPFLPGDGGKLALAVWAGDKLSRALGRPGGAKADG